MQSPLFYCITFSSFSGLRKISSETESLKVMPSPIQPFQFLWRLLYVYQRLTGLRFKLVCSHQLRGLLVSWQTCDLSYSLSDLIFTFPSLWSVTLSR